MRPREIDNFTFTSCIDDTCDSTKQQGLLPSRLCSRCSERDLYIAGCKFNRSSWSLIHCFKHNIRR